MTTNGEWTLTVAGEFSASHQLRHYEGKCEALHGHNFGVEVAVSGTRLNPKTGILLDFKTLKAMLGEVLSLLDHRHLNELPEFTEINPSSETLARFIYEALASKVQGLAVRLEYVSVSEKAGSTATFRSRNGVSSMVPDDCA
ncbi:MAG: 6-carboxytetrahydropterin synthase QueD [Deltaproteobacteria bacterium]|nr:6-carboxytetrahydropterin synthase QueD [Deltaproteobacteria bacterium]